LDDGPHRALEPARRIELDHKRGGMLGLRAVDRAPDQTEGNGTDHPVDLDRRDRRRGSRVSGADDEAGQDQREAQGVPDHRPSAITDTSSKRRFAASSAVIWPGPSYGGDTSTTSAPTRESPWRARTRLSASYDVSPPTSGVPVAGA